MSKQPTKAEQRTAEIAERIEVAKAKLLDGTIGAISVDTCIFTENGYRFDTGILKHLEQFKDNPFKLVFSEMTLKEIRGHVNIILEEAKTKLITALRGVGKHWAFPESKQESVTNELLGPETTKEAASKRLIDFANRCGVQLLEAQSTLDITELLKLYFNVQPPFETSAEKKSEFPDAIALLSLQAWAKKEGTAILFVTKDNGCKRFCQDSEYLYAIDSLSEALKLIQERDVHCAALCKAIEAQINGGSYPDIHEKITDAISLHIWDINWIPDADSAFTYDEELDEVEITHGEFAAPHAHAEFRAVDYRNDMLVVQARFRLEIEATCSFNFFVKDGIDHDMVNIGGTSVSTKDTVKVDVLLTFDSPNEEVPELSDIELIPSRQKIYFGSVSPDYGDEDSSREYY